MSVETGNNPAKEIARKREGDRVRYWYKKFVGSLDSEYAEVGLLRTQEPKIRSLVTTIVKNTPLPGDIINPIITDENIRFDGYGMMLWPSLYYLMQGAEEVVGERFVYTPHEYVESVRGFSDDQVAYYLEKDKARRGELPRELALSSERKERLKKQIDGIVNDPHFIEEHSRHMGRPEYVVFPYNDTIFDWHVHKEKHIGAQRSFLARPDFTEQDRDEVNGKMRSFDTCSFQSEYLLDHLPKHATDVGLLYGEGVIMPYNGEGHDLLFAVPGNDMREMLLTAQKSVFNASLFSIEGNSVETLPQMADITVIDASILQLFDAIPFINQLPHAERIAFARSIAPKSFSKSGVFVDNYTEYVRFLGLMSSYIPSFSVDTDSLYRKNQRRRQNSQ